LKIQIDDKQWQPVLQDLQQQAQQINDPYVLQGEVERPGLTCSMNTADSGQIQERLRCGSRLPADETGRGPWVGSLTRM